MFHFLTVSSDVLQRLSQSPLTWAWLVLVGVSGVMTLIIMRQGGGSSQCSQALAVLPQGLRMDARLRPWAPSSSGGSRPTGASRSGAVHTRTTSAQPRRQLRCLENLQPDRYACFEKIYLPRHNGEGLTLIDALVVSVHGVFVIQTVEGDGLVSGSASDRLWKRRGFLRSWSFLNPVMRGRYHAGAARQQFHLRADCVHSLVLFTGDVNFTTIQPAEVITSGLIQAITCIKEEVISAEDFQRMRDSLRTMATQAYRRRMLLPYLAARHPQMQLALLNKARLKQFAQRQTTHA